MPFGIFLRRTTAAATIAAAKAAASPEKEKAVTSAPKFISPVSDCPHGFDEGYRMSRASCASFCPAERMKRCKAKMEGKSVKPIWAEEDPKTSVVFGSKEGKRFIVVEKVFDGNDVKGKHVIDFRIVAQSHLRDNFCHEGKYFTAKDGYQLRSAGGPGRYGSGHIYLRGDNNVYDHNTVRVSPSEWVQIKNAVAEYNMLYLHTLTPTPVKAPDTKFKVGDLVVATCKYGSPYTTTCDGWKGVINGVSGDFVFVQGRDGSATYSYDAKGFTVEHKYLKLDTEAKAPKAPSAPKAPADPKAPESKRYVKRLVDSFAGVQAGEIVELLRLTPTGQFVVINPHKPLSDNEDTWSKKKGELMPATYKPAPKVKMEAGKKYGERVGCNNTPYEVIGMVAEIVGSDGSYFSVVLPNGERSDWLKSRTKVLETPPAAAAVWSPKEGDLVKCLPSAGARYCDTSGSWKGIIKEVCGDGTAYIQGRSGHDQADSKKGYHVDLVHFALDVDAMAKAKPQKSPIGIYVKRTSNSERVGAILPVQETKKNGYRVIEIDGSTSFWGADYCEEVPAPK